MEGGKQSGSSLASDLFGAKDSSQSASSSGLFSSIFAPSSKIAGLESLHSPKTDKNKYDLGPGNPVWSAKTQVSDKNAIGSEGQMNYTSSYYQEQRVLPLNYSSSIYYGGQDVYSRPQDPQNTFFTTVSGPKRLILCVMVMCLLVILLTYMFVTTSSIKMVEKTTHPALQEGTGGRDPYTTN